MGGGRESLPNPRTEPLLEWHLHTTAVSLEVASEEAKRIAEMIGRKTQVLSEDGEVLTEVNP